MYVLVQLDEEQPERVYGAFYTEESAKTFQEDLCAVTGLDRTAYFQIMPLTNADQLVFRTVTPS